MLVLGCNMYAYVYLYIFNILDHINYFYIFIIIHTE